MKKNYFNSLILGIMCLIIYSSKSQNILYDGDFSETTEIVPFDTLTPPINTWAFRVKEEIGAEANPSVVDGVAKIQIQNPGYDYPDVQLTQLGFPLIQGHAYQLSFDVKADAERLFVVYLGEEGGSDTNLIGFDKFWYDFIGEWKPISLEFIATSVFDLHELSFGLGSDNTTTYFDNIMLQDLGPAPPEKVVIAGTFQSALGCDTDWDPNCDYTELTFNSSTGLYSGTFQIPEGKNRYKVAVGGSWAVNYGENGVLHGADIFLCLSSGSEEITFTYDPSTNLVTTSPITSGFSPDCLPLVVLAGSFQDELGCYGDGIPDCTNTALIYNSGSGLFEGDLNIPTGCYEYRVVLENSWEISFGQGGNPNGPDYSIYIPENPELTHFTYDPVSHVVTSSPYGNPLQEVTKVSLIGTLQDELGCAYDNDYGCDNPALLLNPDTGTWEGSFILPAGCYSYLVQETIGCNNVTYYGENGNEIQLYVPADGEITFIYDPQTHVVTSTPYYPVPEEVTKVSLISSFQQEVGLILNPDSGDWEKTFMLPAGCYSYLVQETIGCNNVTYYGENGKEDNWPGIQLYVPTDGEITFNYDPKTHLISSTPYSGTELAKVSLIGSLQEELGCAYDNDYGCDNPALLLNPDTGAWEGSFTLPSGCYTYRVKETSVCEVTYYYGENGNEWPEIQLYVPSDGEITFSYDPQSHIVTSTPFYEIPEKVTAVSLFGSLQDELGCATDYDSECDQPALQFNSDSNLWEGSFTLPAGCYTYQVKETVGCNDINYYGENGDYIKLYVPSEAEITFSYNPQTHLITSTPYSGNSEEITSVSLEGSLQNELILNADSGYWEGSSILAQGCYTYLVKETFGCIDTLYGKDGDEGTYNYIQLYVPTDGEITFSYDPQTHLISSTPYSGAELAKVSLIGSLQDELGCAYDNDYGCDNPALLLNPDTGAWEGSFTLPAGCYTYRVKETSVCEVTYYYGENGKEWPEIQLYVPSDGEITFSYDPQTHLISSTPYSGAELAKVSLIGSLQDELGCAYDGEEECDKSALILNPDTGAWEGSFTLPAGCYTYRVKETSVCEVTYYYGENGKEGTYNDIQLYVPTEAEITFSYDPQTHIISSTPYGDVPPEMTKVSLTGTFQDKLGCAFQWEDDCANSALEFNPASGIWEGSFTLPAGCYAYRVREATVCGTIEYGENGYEGYEIQLYVREEAEITFSYDPQSHIVTSTPFYEIPEEVTAVSLEGSFQDEPALIYDPDSDTWTGSFTLPAGCYTYQVKETFGCETNLYGENGEYWPPIELYVPTEAEITFSYDPQNHVITSTPYSGIPQEVTAVSLTGLPEEVVCASAGENCTDPALQFNSDTGTWEGSFSLPAGCYYYQVKETSICKEAYYGENGYEWSVIKLYIPTEGEISFSYDPETHLMTTSPYSGVLDEVTSVALSEYFGDSVGYPALTKNEISGNWEGNYELPAGCYNYWVEETVACWNSSLYGENGEAAANDGKVIQLYIPESGEVSFSYDPQTHIMTSTPYTGAPQEVIAVSLTGLPEEVVCASAGENCTDPALQFNFGTGTWEGSFILPAGCYYYQVKESSICKETVYGENGYEGYVIQLYVPTEGEISFSYDPQTHIIISTPYSGVLPGEVTNVNLVGSLEGQYGSIPLSKDEVTGKWEGTFMAPAGCYAYRVEETISCAYNYTYGKDGIENGNEIQLNIPLAGEISFSYDPETHLITSTPYSGAPQEVTKVFLYGSFQEELGCDNVSVYECEKSTLIYNPGSGEWTGSFTLPAGCYYYWIREIVGCNIESDYGKDGVKDGNSIDLYVPTEGEVTFSYDPQTHIITSSPHSGIPQDVTAVSLFGSLQDEFGCAYDFDPGCDTPALILNPNSGLWEGSFTLPAGCYTYRVKETFGCEAKTYYGKDGTKSRDDIWLFVPADAEVTFSYDPQTHIITSTPYSNNSTIVNCPSDIFVNNSSGLCGALVNYPEMVANLDCGGDIFSIIQTEGLPSDSMFPVGTTTNSFVLTKITGEEITCSFDVVVTDTESPVISNLNQVYEPLWPPNHKMVPVFIEYVASDNCNISTAELSISSNEPETGLGNGDKAPDWEILDEHNVLLRAERSGKGDGREYTITIKVTDSSGNFTQQFVTVTVPLNNSKMSQEFSASENSSYKYILYPNAAVDIINLKGPKSTSGHAYAIYDMLGIMKKKGTIDNEQIEVHTLLSGVYILKFEMDQGYIFKKFIKN